LPTGTAQLFEGGKALGNPVQLEVIAGQPATANFSGFSLTAGLHDFSVSYSGDSVYQSTAFNFQIPVFSPFAFDPAPNSSLSATVRAGQTATYNLLLSSEGLTGSVALNCGGAPAGTTCTVNPASAFLPTSASTVPVTVTVTTTALARNERFPFATMPFAIAAILVLPLTRRRRKLRPAFLMVLAVIVVLVAGVSSCGGNGTPTATNSAGPSSTSALLTITGTSNGASNGVTLQLTITR
jgi:hypothetical protein